GGNCNCKLSGAPETATPLGMVPQMTSRNGPGGVVPNGGAVTLSGNVANAAGGLMISPEIGCQLVEPQCALLNFSSALTIVAVTLMIGALPGPEAVMALVSEATPLPPSLGACESNLLVDPSQQSGHGGSVKHVSYLQQNVISLFQYSILMQILAPGTAEGPPIVITLGGV